MIYLFIKLITNRNRYKLQKNSYNYHIIITKLKAGVQKYLKY